ncbi:oxidoreductase, FAD-binding protein [Roseobacter sp. SK209-2-6]|uniref:NAD(P)/FAD-dependent oxidoreductase n=1 Tax=Roseobacter sp. SK209-2-6 TaxID=388739 RepID=UPI0000F3C80F|nr:FAD-binding oxidoreductase [Roseobacter sp. SK209-2-6]EBA18662.1 oxidoreductase, FAD-binding protein [Roseobacter sp. SK209-2-6]
MIYDFLVIGGGLAGIGAAAKLSSLGSILILEMEEALGYHASGRSAAMFEENYGPAAVCALSRASAEHHRSNGCLSPRGFMLVGGPQNAEIFAQDMQALALEPITAEEARAKVPILHPEHVTMAGWHEEAQDLDADLLLQGFAKSARANGAEIVTRKTASAISRNGSSWEVTVGDQVFEARQLVNAAGAWADQIAALAGVAPIGLQPKRRSMARLPAPGGHDVTSWPMIMGAGETWYAKPDAGKLLVSPAEADPVEPHDAYADDMVLAEGLARYEENVTEPVTRVESNWAGLRSFAPDGCLVLGPDPNCPEFIWSAGQGGYGVQTSPAAAQLVADLVAGRSPELDQADVAALTPARLR